MELWACWKDIAISYLHVFSDGETRKQPGGSKMGSLHSTGQVRCHNNPDEPPRVELHVWESIHILPVKRI